MNNPSPLLKSSFQIFGLRFFPVMASLAVFIYLSRQISLEQYGAYQNFWTHYYILGTLVTSGIPVFILIYASGKARQILQHFVRSRYLKYWLLWVGLITAVFSILEYNSAAITIPVSCAFIWVLSAIAILESLLIVEKKFTALISGSLLYGLAFLIIHYWQVQQGFSLQIVLSSIVMVNTLRLGIYLFIYYTGIKKNTRSSGSDSLDLNEIKSIWLHMGLNDWIQILSRWADKFIVSFLFTKEIAAIYFNGSIEIPFIPIILGAVGSAGIIHLADASPEKNRTIKETMHFSGRLLSSVALPLFFFFIYYRTEIFHTVFTNKYEASIPIFFAGLWILPLRSFHYTAVLQHLKRGDIINKGAILDIVLYLLLLYPLYLLLGLPGIAYSFVIATFIQSVYYIKKSSDLTKIKWYNMIPYKNWMLKLLFFYISIMLSITVYNNLNISVNYLAYGIGIAATQIIISLLADMKISKSGFRFS